VLVKSAQPRADEGSIRPEDTRRLHLRTGLDVGRGTLPVAATRQARWQWLERGTRRCGPERRRLLQVSLIGTSQGLCKRMLVIGGAGNVEAEAFGP